MEIANKIVIADKQSATIPLKNLVGTLFWKTKVDLDLHCFYETKDGRKGQVYYGAMVAPSITLDEDSGVGGSLASGGNEENLRFADLTNYKHLLIVANIYSSNDNWKKHGGNVTVKAEDKAFIVPLDADFSGKWCVVAHVDNSSPMGAELKNVNKVFINKPSISDIDNNFQNAVTAESAPRGRGLIGRLFS